MPNVIGNAQILLWSNVDRSNYPTFDRYDLPIKIHPVGVGGTNFRPLFEWVEEKRLRPAYLVYLTDMEGTRFPDDPGYPAFWAQVGKEEANPPIEERLKPTEY